MYIPWAQQIKNARNGNAENAVLFFENHIADHKNIPNFLADYLTVNNWAGNYEEVVAAITWKEIQTIPDYGHAAIANSFKNLGQYAKALRIYSQLTKGDFDDEITWLQNTLNQ